ncbi:MAG: hypothetical protein K2Q26_07785 [Bdellovibrionales bacterium]|nr:hypothetical protein [Bdellovibrionales bacterium]
MKTIKNKIKSVIKESNGYPTYSQREYLDAIRLILNEGFSSKELEYIESESIDLDQWIMEITEEVMSDLF